MPKQDITVEIPEGYEATGEFRQAATGEIVADANGAAHTFSAPSGQRYIILRKTYVPPAWIKSCYLIKDAHGIWWASNSSYIHGGSMRIDETLLKEPFVAPPTSPYQVK